MGRKAIEINQKSGGRIKTICAEQGITQKALALAINYAPEHISNIVRGIKGLSFEAAQRICKAYPMYNVDWLLGINDVKTKDEWELLIRAQDQYESIANDILNNRYDIVLSAISMIAKTLNQPITRCKDGGIIIDYDYGPKTELESPPIFKIAVKVSPEGTRILVDSVRDYMYNKLYELYAISLSADKENLYAPMPPKTRHNLEDYKPFEGRAQHGQKEP